MDRKFLENFGLEKEQIDQILDEHSLDIGRKKNENDSKIDAERLKYESLQKELEKANETIKSLQKSNKENTNLQTEIEKYKQEIETVRKEAEQQKIDMTLQIALKEAGAINPRAVMPFIEKDKIAVNRDGEVTGISEQLSTITANDDLKFLFRGENETPVIKPETPERGGFEPLKAESNKSEESLSMGAIIGREFRKMKEEEKSAEDYWSKIE